MNPFINQHSFDKAQDRSPLGTRHSPLATRHSPLGTRHLLLLSLTIFLAIPAIAQLPLTSLSEIFPPGGQIGTTFEVSISGSDLDEVNQLLFSHPGISAQQKRSQPDAPPQPDHFIVSISDQTPPGSYEARGRGRFGVSNPRTFAVSQLPEILEDGTHDSPSQAAPLPFETVLNGHSDKNAVDYYQFTAQQGQRFLIQCRAPSIDSRMSPSLILFDSDGQELARNRTGGPIDFTPPSNADYLLKVHDFLYNGGSAYFYRLSLSSRPHLDFILPPAGTPGSKTNYVLYGRNLPGSTPVPDWTIDGQPLEKLTVEIELPADPAQPSPRTVLLDPAGSSLDGTEYRFQGSNGVSNPLFIGFATAPLIAEHDANDQPDLAQQISPPCEYFGQFFPAGDRDWLTFQAKKGDVYWIEVFSHRLGVPSNPFVLLQRVTKSDQGQDQASDVKELYDSDTNIGGPDFNTTSRDPSWRFEVKEDGDYRLQIVDLFNQNQSRPDRIYRLSVRKESPDFRLVALPSPPTKKDKKEVLQWSLVARRGETIPIRVLSFRKDNFNGPIQLSVEGLPEGLHCTPTPIDANATSTTLLITADTNATAWTGPLLILGKATINHTEVVRQARGGTVRWTVGDYNNQPVSSRLCDQLPLAINSEESVPISIRIPDRQNWETSVAGKLTIPLQVNRHGEFNEKLKLKPAGNRAFDKAKEFELEGNAAEGSYQLDLTKTKLEPGTYTLFLQTQTKGKYRNNPEAADQAELAAKEAETIFNDLKEATAKNEAEQQAAAKTAAEAEAKIKEAQETLAQAVQARQLAQENATELTAKLKEAETKKDQTAHLAKTANERAKPKEVTIPVYSSPFTLTVTPAPITLPPPDPPAKVAQGAKIDIPIAITRLYDYSDPVELRLIFSADTKGFKAEPITIPASQSESKLTLEIASDSPLGPQQFVLEAKLKLNDQEIKLSHPLSVVITQSQPPPTETQTQTEPKPDTP